MNRVRGRTWAAAVVAVVLCANGMASAAPSASLKKLTGAGYQGSTPGMDEVQATFVVPRVSCRTSDVVASIGVSLENKKASALGEVEIACRADRQAEDNLIVYAGSAGAVALPAEVVHAGNRVRVTVGFRNGRLRAEASVAGRHPIHTSVKGSSVDQFEIGEFNLGPKWRLLGPVVVRHADLDGKPIGDAANLTSTKERMGGRVVAAPGPLRRGQSFTIRSR